MHWNEEPVRRNERSRMLQLRPNAAKNKVKKKKRKKWGWLLSAKPAVSITEAAVGKWDMNAMMNIQLQFNFVFYLLKFLLVLFCL